MNTEVTLNSKNLQRRKVLNELESGRMTAKAAAGLLGLSLRQVRRLRAGYRPHGAAALPHGNRGCPSPHRIPEAVHRQVLEWGRRRCPDYNDCHLTDVLAEEHGVKLSRSTVRRFRHAAGLRGPRLVLIAAIDDATGEVAFALFREQEDAVGYFRLLREIAKRQGLPLALEAGNGPNAP